MKRAVVLTIAVLGLLFGSVGPAAADVHPPGPDPESASHWYDAEGVRHLCIDTDPDLGCLTVVQMTDTEFIMYWIGNDGVRKSYRIPKDTGYSGYAEADFAVRQEYQQWFIWWWVPYAPVGGDYTYADPNAYPPCDCQHSC